MRIIISALFSCLFFNPHVVFSQADRSQQVSFNFLNDSIHLSIYPAMLIEYNKPVGDQSLREFYNNVNNSEYQTVVRSLLLYKKQKKLNDWIYYQLIRKTAQQLSPKAENYERYTLYKWFLLTKSGYDAHLALEKNQLLFYVRSDD